jgi:hypothetical protein
MGLPPARLTECLNAIPLAALSINPISSVKLNYAMLPTSFAKITSCRVS